MTPSPTIAEAAAEMKGQNMSNEKREQATKQCKAVAHMATALAQVYTDYAEMFSKGAAENLIEPVGVRTARVMEKLGDILNGMDAVTEEDEWIFPIFEKARRLWPQEKWPVPLAFEEDK